MIELALGFAGGLALGLGVGMARLAAWKEAKGVTAPLQIKDYVEQRIEGLTSSIPEGTGYVDKDRVRLAELKSLQFQIARAEED